MLPLLSSAQSYQSTDGHFGLSAGLVLNFGTHVNALGINLNAFYTDYFFQVNAGNSFQFNINSYGKRRNFIENRTSLGLQLLAGKRQQTPDFELDASLHNTSFNYGVGFNYIYYFDNAGTSQFSGAWALHIKKLSIIHENDVFGGQHKDRFRTGHFVAQYRLNEDVKISAGLNIWTGETRHSIWQHIETEKMPSGFRVLEDLLYGRTSHGVLYAGVHYRIPFYGQVAQARIGIDSEHIRHAVQNRLMHDLLFLPKKIERNTPHYPRLDEEGCPVFEKELVRKNRFYFQLGSNEYLTN
ncbi:MAG: polymorphic toxin type 23 domain-containing protein [Bacteroidota bacterium]